MSSSFHMTAPAAAYRQRRAKLARELKRPLVLFSGLARARNYQGNDHPFRASSTYLYFGGPPLEGAALVIEPQSNGSDDCTLLRVPPAPGDALWHGVMPDDAAVAAATGLETTALADPDQLESVLAGREAAHLEVPCHATVDWISTFRLKVVRTDPLSLSAVTSAAMSAVWMVGVEERFLEEHPTAKTVSAAAARTWQRWASM